MIIINQLSTREEYHVLQPMRTNRERNRVYQSWCLRQAGKCQLSAGPADLLAPGTCNLSLLRRGNHTSLITQSTDSRPEATFACLTNVDFDPARFDAWIRKAVQLRNDLKDKVVTAGGSIASDNDAVTFIPAPDLAGLEAQGGALNFIETLDDKRGPSFFETDIALRYSRPGRIYRSCRNSRPAGR